MTEQVKGEAQKYVYTGRKNRKYGQLCTMTRTPTGSRLSMLIFEDGSRILAERHSFRKYEPKPETKNDA